MPNFANFMHIKTFFQHSSERVFRSENIFSFFSHGLKKI